jgi:hypothetical protein
MFLSRESRQANLIAIVEEGIPLPFDIAKIALIVRPREWSDQNHEFLRALANRLEALSRQLEPAREHEAMRLLEKKEYRAAVVAAFTQLEHDLRTAFSQQEPTVFSSRVSMLHLVERAFERGVFKSEERKKLREYMAIRNQLVHTREGISAARAKQIAMDLIDFSIRVRQAEGRN